MTGSEGSPGTLLAGRYAFEAELTAGGSGRVMRVRDTLSGERRVAKAVDPANAARLCAELDALREVHHPAILQAHELLRLPEMVGPPFTLPAGTAVLVTAWVPGDTLAATGACGSWQELAALGGTLAAALAALHAADVVHGDVSPNNVMITPEGPVLIDLGHAGSPRTLGAGAAGTLAFMAPEAFSGARTPATDLFSLAATLLSVAPGSPVTDTRRLTLTEAHERAMRWGRELNDRLLGAPSPLRDVLRALLLPNAADRLDDADEVARRLRWEGQGVPADDAETGGLLSAHPRGKRSPKRVASAIRNAAFVGHDVALARAVAAVRARAADALPATLVEVYGPAGSGGRRFSQELAQRLQRVAFDAGWTVPTVARATVWVPPEHPAILLADAEGGQDAARLLRFLDATEVERAPCTVIVRRNERADGTETSSDRRVSVTLGPVGAADVRTVLTRSFGEAPSDPEVDAALALSGGLLGSLCDTLAVHALEGTLTRPRDLLRVAARPHGQRGALPKLPTPTLELLERASVSPDGLPLDSETPEGLSAALTLGLLAVSASGWLVPRTDVRESVLRNLTRARRVSLATALLSSTRDPLARAHLALSAERPEQAEEELTTALRRLGTEAFRHVEPQSLVELLQRLRAPSPATRLAVAEWLRRRAEPDAALSVLDAAQDTEAVLLRVEILRQRGDVEGAQRALATVATRARSPGEEEVFLRTAGRLALELERRAGTSAERAPSPGPSWSVSTDQLLADFAAAHPSQFDESPALHELKALRAWQHADVEGCDTEAELAGALYARRGQPGQASRCAALRAMVAQRRGDAASAYTHGRRAVDLAEGAGERLAAAAFGLNLGLACFELGQLGEALARVRTGAEQIADLGNLGQLAHAALNLAHIHQAFGDDNAAAELLPLAERSAREANQPSVVAHADITWAGIELRRGKRQASIARVDAALERISSCSDEARPLLFARAALALAEAGLRERAAAALGAPELADKSQQVDAARMVDLARGTLALTGTFEERRAAVDALASGSREARGWESQLDAALLQAQLLERLGDGPASLSALRRARSRLDVALDSLPNALRPLLLGTARYHAALRVPPLDDGTSPSAGRAGDVFRELPTWVQRFIQAGPPARLMQRIADAAQALTRAERGFLIEREPSGSWLTLACTEEAPGPALAFSRSVASRALATGRVISALDALDDAQLGTSSVLGIGTRSVLAAPLRCPGRELVLYVDDRLRPAAFDPLSEDVFSACTQLAGLALSANLDAAELLAKQQALTAAEAALRAHVETQRDELTSLRRAVPSAERGGIIAGPGAMRQALELAERAAASAVPVLLLGESGTGKELVARFLHEHSDRRAQRFISENCAAIPDTLLESALFGHERGAFTGADRARPGLFHAADGGTLFLDEIGEMSAAMQSKLLRVLQNGEVRAVGGSRVSHVNVRLITATHRDLRAMVAAGTFREDLYYRVTVVSLELPPLRERRGDIPLLVRHFMGKHQPGAARRITPDAMQRLVSAPWPGNVRQLENEVQRLLVMAGDPIDVRDVTPIVTPANAASSGGDDVTVTGSLGLREHVDGLERRLIQEALRRSDNNQTRAAQELGVSRFGLQKMMKRLGLRS